MILEKEIEASIVKINKIPEDKFVEDYQAIIKEQEELFKFVVQSTEQFNMEEDAKNAVIELMYNNLNIYKDKYADKYPTVIQQTIIDVISQRNIDEQRHAGLLGVDIEDKNAGAAIEEMYQNINKAIASGEADKLDGQLKKLYDFMLEQNNKIKQKHLFEYNTYFIDKDELIEVKDKPTANMIVETIVESLEKQMQQ